MGNRIAKGFQLFIGRAQLSRPCLNLLFQLFAEFHSLCLFALLQFFSFLEYVTLLGLFQVLTGFILLAPSGLFH